MSYYPHLKELENFRTPAEVHNLHYNIHYDCSCPLLILTQQYIDIEHASEQQLRQNVLSDLEKMNNSNIEQLHKNLTQFVNNIEYNDSEEVPAEVQMSLSTVDTLLTIPSINQYIFPYNGLPCDTSLITIDDIVATDIKEKKTKRKNRDTRERDVTYWSKEEDLRVLTLLWVYKDGAYPILSSELGRSIPTIKQHYLRVLDPNIRKGCWRDDETEILINLIQDNHRMHDKAPWSEIAKHLKHRTDVQCRSKWDQLYRKKSSKKRYKNRH
ncbi:hypothetical protein PCE1_000794 [Barthelona sp. PCE]